MLMKYLLILALILSAAPALSDTTVLPDVFWLKCKGTMGRDHLIKIDRQKKTAFLKLPFVEKWAVCEDNDDLIVLRSDCEEKGQEYEFNKWDSSLSYVNPFAISFDRCGESKILTEDQTPLFR